MHQLYESVPVGVVLALPSKDTLADTFGNWKLPTVPPPTMLVFVGIDALPPPLLAKVTTCGLVVPLRLAVGAELLTLKVCETGTLDPIVEAVSWTVYAPVGDVGTLSMASVPQGFVRSSVAAPSSSAFTPKGTDKTCQRQLTGLPGAAL